MINWTKDKWEDVQMVLDELEYDYVCDFGLYVGHVGLPFVFGLDDRFPDPFWGVWHDVADGFSPKLEGFFPSRIVAPFGLDAFAFDDHVGRIYGLYYSLYGKCSALFALVGAVVWPNLVAVAFASLLWQKGQEDA